MAGLYPGISGGSIPASGDTESGAGEFNNFPEIWKLAVIR
jgi:hypothetical protein